MHVRLRKEHYDAFRDVKTLYAEETSKEPCKRFMHTGECVFGGNCRFTHYTWQQLDIMRQHIESETKPQGSAAISVEPGEAMNKLSVWLKKRGKVVSATDMEPDMKHKWDLPPSLQGRQDLPPSLQPLSPHSFTNSEFEDWG
ncbi:hypothetical protein L9F63_028218 [Diploptera punctata]|uniref:C3H1-type domain-containing protein n=1 Tax=Diploptera punctata TaxID=6984 RepID=A0AAD7ZXC7_DIPPU|nr:hypothetical protein L9F63_028218 [Diploptera punctata]